MSITKVFLQEWNLHDSVDEVKEDLKKKGIPLGEEVTEYISAGSYGDVYALKDYNKVLKIHENEFEFETTNKIMNSGKNFKNIVKFHFNKKLGGYYIVVMERLQAIDQEISSRGSYGVSYLAIVTMHYNVKMSMSLYREVLADRTELFDDELIAKLQKAYGDSDLYWYLVDACSHINTAYNTEIAEDTLKFYIDNPDFIKDVFNGIQELHSIGVDNEDLHVGNVLYDPKTNKYKIIDMMA